MRRVTVHRPSRVFTTTLLALVIGSAMTPSPAWPQLSPGLPQSSIVTAAHNLSVEWQRRQAARGPLITGYVVNSYGIPAARVSVLVEGLDSAGQVVNETVGYVVGTVPALSRTYFEVRVPDATSYRVVVASSDWIKGTGAR